jgi:hypothetical protein
MPLMISKMHMNTSPPRERGRRGHRSVEEEFVLYLQGVSILQNLIQVVYAYKMLKDTSALQMARTERLRAPDCASYQTSSRLR